MLTLNDGRNELWQWDTCRTLAVDADCSQVHFSNKVFGRSIDVDVVDGVAVIPDILLQTDKDLNVWAFVGTPENGYTKISKVFKVNKRSKPADYVFTPPEQTTLEEIKEKLDYLESIQDPDAIKNAVDEYLANNPIQIDEKDPTVPDWAKQTTKPKYTATEVGAVAKVNGVKPDANGNVEITIPDSGGNVDETIEWKQVGKAQEGRIDTTTGEFLDGNWAAYVTTFAEVEPNCRYRVTTNAYQFIVLFKDILGNVISYVRASYTTSEAYDNTFNRYTDYEVDVPENAHTLWITSKRKYYSADNDQCTDGVIMRAKMPETLGSLSGKIEAMENRFPLEGKNIVNFGDSIFGWFDAPDDISTKIAELTGANVYNVGFGAMWMSSRSGEAGNFCMCGLADSVASQDFLAQETALETWADESAVASFTPTVATLKSIDFSAVDIITIAYGTNDFTANVPLEHATDKLNKYTFAGALRYSIETILTAHPHIKIYVCTPIYRFYLDNAGGYSHDSDTEKNTNEATLVDFAEKAIEVAREYHLPYIDNYNDLGFNKFTRLEYFSATDGTHPNLDGRHLIARHMAKKLW